MYDRLVTEGHDARLLRFSPSADGTIPGSHKNPKNDEYWKVGCLGITEGIKSNNIKAKLFQVVIFHSFNGHHVFILF